MSVRVQASACVSSGAQTCRIAFIPRCMLHTSPSHPKSNLTCVHRNLMQKRIRLGMCHMPGLPTVLCWLECLYACYWRPASHSQHLTIVDSSVLVSEAATQATKLLIWLG